VGKGGQRQLEFTERFFSRRSSGSSSMVGKNSKDERPLKTRGPRAGQSKENGRREGDRIFPVGREGVKQYKEGN